MRLKTVDRLDLAIGGDHAGNFLAHNFFRAHGRARVPPVDSGEEQHRCHHQHQHNRHATAAPAILARSCHALTELLPTKIPLDRAVNQCRSCQPATASASAIKNQWPKLLSISKPALQRRSPVRLACGPEPSANPLQNFSAWYPYFR